MPESKHLRDAVAEAMTALADLEHDNPTQSLNPKRALTPAAAARRRRVSLAGIVAGWAGMAWIWIAQPAFLFGPSGSPTLAPAVQEAQDRYAMYLTRARVEEFRQDSGYYPVSTAVLGDSEDGVQYRLTDTGYIIESLTGTVPMPLTERTDANSFLGNALDVLASAQ